MKKLLLAILVILLVSCDCGFTNSRAHTITYVDGTTENICAVSCYAKNETVTCGIASSDGKHVEQDYYMNVKSVVRNYSGDAKCTDLER